MVGSFATELARLQDRVSALEAIDTKAAGREAKLNDASMTDLEDQHRAPQSEIVQLRVDNDDLKARVAAMEALQEDAG